MRGERGEVGEGVIDFCNNHRLKRRHIPLSARRGERGEVRGERGEVDSYEIIEISAPNLSAILGQIIYNLTFNFIPMIEYL